MDNIIIVAIAKVTGTLLSWLDAANLRNRVYQYKAENELLILALQDIKRIDKTGLCGKIAADRLERIGVSEMSDKLL